MTVVQDFARCFGLQLEQNAAFVNSELLLGTHSAYLVTVTKNVFGEYSENLCLLK